MAPLRPLGLVLLAVSTGACWGNEETVFPLGLEPLEATNRAVWPDPVDEDEHPETIRLINASTDEYEWVHAKAYVHGALPDVWRALQDPEVLVDRRAVAKWSAEDGVEEGFDVSLRIHNEVHEILTVQFDVTWRQSAVAGSRDDPEAVALRFQKTYGTSFIGILRGSIVARAVDDETTSLELIEHINAAMSGADKITNYLRDLHASTVARVHGRPLPTYAD